jgi:hypothetical protein
LPLKENATSKIMIVEEGPQTEELSNERRPVLYRRRANTSINLTSIAEDEAAKTVESKVDAQY